jgi:hypothetical protein
VKCASSSQPDGRAGVVQGAHEVRAGDAGCSRRQSPNRHSELRFHVDLCPSRSPPNGPGASGSRAIAPDPRGSLPELCPLRPMLGRGHLTSDTHTDQPARRPLPRFVHCSGHGSAGNHGIERRDSDNAHASDARQTSVGARLVGRVCLQRRISLREAHRTVARRFFGEAGSVRANGSAIARTLAAILFGPPLPTRPAGETDRKRDRRNAHSDPVRPLPTRPAGEAVRLLATELAHPPRSWGLLLRPASNHRTRSPAGRAGRGRGRSGSRGIDRSRG